MKGATRNAGRFGVPLATYKPNYEIKNNPIDIEATSRLNKLYVELLKENEDWPSEARRQELNQVRACSPPASSR
jgi:hypothetical protein